MQDGKSAGLEESLIYTTLESLRGCVAANQQNLDKCQNQTAPGSIQRSLFERGHRHGPNTNMANGLGNPTASLIEAGSLTSSV